MNSPPYDPIAVSNTVFSFVVADSEGPACGRVEKMISFRTWAIKPCWASEAILVLEVECKPMSVSSALRNKRTYRG